MKEGKDMSFHGKASIVTPSDILLPVISGMHCKIINAFFPCRSQESFVHLLGKFWSVQNLA